MRGRLRLSRRSDDNENFVVQPAKSDQTAVAVTLTVPFENSFDKSGIVAVTVCLSESIRARARSREDERAAVV